MAEIANELFFKSSPTDVVGEFGAKTTQGNRTFRWAKAGASALDPGKLCVAPTVVANHINRSWATVPAVGDMVVFVTLGATAATANQYKDGFLVVQDGTGEGRAYEIEGNTAVASGGGTCEISLKEAIRVAGAASESGCDLIANPYSAAVISVTDQADEAIGVPVTAIPAGEFGWLQTGGPCSVLFDEAVTNGLAVTIGTGVAGAVEAADGAGEQVVGVVAGTAGVDTEYQLVNLKIDSADR
jgi:hypothetical protein